MTKPVVDFSRISKSAAARAIRPPDKHQPLFRHPPEQEEYPVDALMQLQRPIEVLQDKSQAPMAMVANSLLATTALATQPHFDVEAPVIGRVPLSLFLLTVGVSGERKTFVDKHALEAVERIQREWRHDYQMNNYRQLNAIDVWNARRKRIMSQHKEDSNGMRTALDELGAEPGKPMPPQLLIGDASIEKIMMHLAERPSAGIFSAEAGTVIGGSSFSEDHIKTTPPGS